MPFIPYVPVPTAPVVPTGTMGATAGGGVQSSLDHSLAIASVGKQLEQIQFYLSGGPGGVATTESGSLTNVLMRSSASLASIDGALQLLVVGSNKQVGSALSGANSVQQSLSTVAGLLTTMIAMQQMQMAATMQHQEFIEQTTNTARAEDNKPPIVPKTDDYIKKVQNASTGVANIASISAATGTATALAGDALKAGATYAKNLIASTDLGAAMILKAKEVETFIASKADAAAQTAQATLDSKTAHASKAERSAKAGELPK
jgi:hypothetical protein